MSKAKKSVETSGSVEHAAPDLAEAPAVQDLGQALRQCLAARPNADDAERCIGGEGCRDLPGLLVPGGVTLPLGHVAVPLPAVARHVASPQTGPEIFLPVPRYLRQPERGPPVTN